LAALIGAVALILTSRANAQDAEETALPGDETPAASSERSEPSPPANSALMLEASETSSESTSLGLRYRGVLSPKPMIGCFVEGKTMYVNGVRPELAIPDGDDEYLLSDGLALDSMSSVAEKLVTRLDMGAAASGLFSDYSL
jgi:hypothetical protein